MYSHDFKSHLKSDLLTPLISQEKIKDERKGTILVVISTVIIGCNTFYIKLIQTYFPKVFSTIPFLFIRAVAVITLSFGISLAKSEEIIKPGDLKHKKWFFLRTNGSFFVTLFFILSLSYLRVSTAQIINALNPIFAIILSNLILKEKLYLRYLVGIFLSLIGAVIIVLNERHPLKMEDGKISEEYTLSPDTIKGVIFGIVANLILSLVQVSNKFLVDEKVPFITQLFYASLSMIIYTIIYIFFSGNFYATFLYTLMTLSQGLIFAAGQFFLYQGLSHVELSKISGISYLRIILVFFLGYIFLGERIYFSDIMGSALILIYPLYNYLYPKREI